VRVHGSIVEPPLNGEKDQRAEFATVVDRVASRPAAFRNRSDAAPGNSAAFVGVVRKDRPPARRASSKKHTFGCGCGGRCCRELVTRSIEGRIGLDRQCSRCGLMGVLLRHH
jgi:hypothetical protein